MKVGIELEFWVIDEEGKLDWAKPVAERVYFASHEFSKSMIEIQTEPHEDLSELFKEAISKTEILCELAKKDGKRIVPLGTPLKSGDVEVHESERSLIEKQVIGEEVMHAGRAAGFHIHFDKQSVIDQLNSLIALDPVMAAVNSSPYYQGRPVANGSRNKIYRYRACGPFPKQRQLWSYKQSVVEWQEKREELFSEFREKAVEKGLDEERLERHFSPEDAVWTPVRLREDYPTVEWRAPDATFLSQAITLIQEITPLIRNNSVAQNLPEFEEVDSISDVAMEKGLKSGKVRNYIEKIGVDHQKFSPLSQRLPEKEEITREEARETRLKFAEKLEKDLEKAKEMIE